jgi:hypothetical protein
MSHSCRVSLHQLVRFLVVKLTHSILNLRFDMSVIFTVNYFSVGGDVIVDRETFLMTDFMNLKINLTQFFRGAHRSRICVHVFIRLSANTYITICIYTVFLKKKSHT